MIGHEIPGQADIGGDVVLKDRLVIGERSVRLAQGGWRALSHFGLRIKH